MVILCRQGDIEDVVHITLPEPSDDVDSHKNVVLAIGYDGIYYDTFGQLAFCYIHDLQTGAKERLS